MVDVSVPTYPFYNDFCNVARLIFIDFVCLFLCLFAACLLPRLFVCYLFNCLKVRVAHTRAHKHKDT